MSDTTGMQSTLHCVLSPQSSRGYKRPRIAEQARQRASRACDRCRRLKEKCEGGSPCTRCSRSKKVCEFNNVNATESSKVASSNDERINCLEQIVTHFLGDVSLSLSSLRRIVDKIRAKTSIKPGHAPLIDDPVGTSLEEENFAVKTLPNSAFHYSGEFSHWNFSQKIRKRVDLCLDPAITKDLKEHVHVIEYFRASQLQSCTSTITAALACLPSWDAVEVLLQVYFQYAQTNSLYVEETWLRGKVDLLKKRLICFTSNDSGWICAVLMVLAIGCQFSHMAPGSCLSTFSISEDVGVDFYRTATKLIPDIITIASLESVQACLLLAHYTLPLDTQGLAYTYIGLALKMAIQNGLHRSYAGSEFDAYTLETRNRLWWMAYTLERRICVLHGRPNSVSLNDIDAEFPTDMQSFGSSHTLSIYTHMMASIHLTARLGEISSAITLLRRCPKNLQLHYLEHIFEHRQKLRLWWSNLPSSVSCQDLLSNMPMLRQNIHLRLCFLLNEIFMGRPFISLNSRTKHSQDTDITESSLSRPDTKEVLASGAVAAAVEIIDLCHVLHQNVGLARASYNEFSSCRAALLVILAQSLNENSERLKDSLSTGIELIRRMTINNDSAKSEVSVIEALEAAVRRLKHNGNNEDTSYGNINRWSIALNCVETGTERQGRLHQGLGQTDGFVGDAIWEFLEFHST